MPRNPFALIDQTGVSQLVKIACERGNQTRTGIKLGPARLRQGENGGSLDSVKFYHREGLTCVYRSPYCPTPSGIKLPWAKINRTGPTQLFPFAVERCKIAKSSIRRPVVRASSLWAAAA